MPGGIPRFAVIVIQATDDPILASSNEAKIIESLLIVPIIFHALKQKCSLRVAGIVLCDT
jgi:hypothetical protein